MFQRFTATILLIALIASVQLVSGACGPPMCNDNLLFAPAMVKLVYNHMHGNTSLTKTLSGKNVPCTACLPCCDFLSAIEQSTLEQRHEIESLNSIVNSIDWNCKSADCAPHHVELRNMVSQIIEQKTQPLLKAMPLNEVVEGNDITTAIRDHLEMYSREVRRSRDHEKTNNAQTFLKNLLSCPCTACLPECAVRKMLFKMF